MIDQPTILVNAVAINKTIRIVLVRHQNVRGLGWRVQNINSRIRISTQNSLSTIFQQVGELELVMFTFSNFQSPIIPLFRERRSPCFDKQPTKLARLKRPVPKLRVIAVSMMFALVESFNFSIAPSDVIQSAQACQIVVTTGVAAIVPAKTNVFHQNRSKRPARPLLTARMRLPSLARIGNGANPHRAYRWRYRCYAWCLVAPRMIRFSNCTVRPKIKHETYRISLGLVQRWC